MYKDTPDIVITFNLLATLFKNTPLEHNIMGSADSVSNISINMMRDFIGRYYSLNNAVITITGSVGGPDIEDKLNELFPPMKKNNRSTDRIDNPWKNWNRNWEGNHVVEIEPKDRPLTYVATAWGMPGTAAGKGLVMEMINTMIGNSKTSLVYKEIIGKGIIPSLRYMFLEGNWNKTDC